MAEPNLAPSDRSQNQYHRHNTADTPGVSYHCGCASCQALRRKFPRLAATIDGQVETDRRAYLYRKGEVT